MRNFGLLGTSALGSVTFIGLSMAFAAPAYAQTAQDQVEAACDNLPEGAEREACLASDAQPVPAANADGSNPSGNNIVITGSRIRRNQFNTADSVQVITRDDATQAGFNSTAELLQSNAVTGGSAQISNIFGGFVTAGGPGANTVSLRGLGTTRTLVLLNGRRVAPAGSRGQVGAVDLNVLPNAMIDRVEILNTGASSIYGSDAVAGVINIVTRQKLDGLSLEAQHNIVEEGAGMSRRYSAVFGKHTDRLNFGVSLEYYDRDTLKLGDRDFTKCQTSYRRAAGGGAPGTGDFIDPITGQPKCYPTGVTGESGVTVNTIGTPNFNGTQVALAPGIPVGYGALPASAGLGTAAQQVCNRFRPRPGAGGALPGYECVGGGFLSLGIRDTFPGSILGDDFLAPVKIYTGFAQASYEIGAAGNAEIYAELLVNRRKSSQTSNRQFTIDYPQGSPLIPALFRFTPAFLGPQPGGITGTNPIGVRIFADYGNYNNRQTVDFVKFNLGIRGDFFIPDWRYDAYVGKSWADSDYTTDLILTDRLAQSLDVVQTGSTFTCRNNIAGCVAAPAVSDAVIGGTLPQAFRDFVVTPVTGHTAFKEEVAVVGIDGPLFDLPGGPIQIAVGAEYRKSSLDDSPSTESVRGNLYAFTSSSPTRGSDSVWEVFGEIELPIIRDSFIHEFTINASARYTEYESYGGQETWKVGGLLSPTTWLSFRGSYGTSYRAPALFEQFLGSTSGFQSQNNDPCNNYGALTAGSPRAANCASEGLPGNFQATTSIAVLQRGGAETGLSAETSKAWTAGGVIQPKLGSLGDLSISLDYFHILVENGVSQLGFGTILAQCYDDARFRENSICNNVTRAAAAPFGLTVTTGYVNVSNAKVAGWDFNLRYSVPVGPGRLRLGAAITKYETRYSQTLPTDQIFNVIGTLNNPEWTGTFDANYAWDNWTLRYGVDWVDAMNSDAAFLGITQAVRDTYVLETDDLFIHTASLRYQTKRFGLTLGVRNLFDKEPPQISSGFYNRVGNSPLYSGYETLSLFAGRTFFVNAVTHF